MDKLLRSSQTGISQEDHSQDSMMLLEDMIIDIETAEYVESYQLRIQFSDGQERIVDFEPFLSKSLNPLIKKYLDLERFKNFTVEYGDLHWNDYDLCFPIADLYQGQI